MKSVVKGSITLAVAVILWEASCRAFGIRPFVLPKPTDVARALWEYGGALGEDTCVSAAAAAGGFLISAVASLALAVSLIYAPALKSAALSGAVVLKSVPVVILAPIFLVWFGYGLTGKLLLAAIITFFPLLIALVQGMTSVTRAERDLFRVYGASRWQAVTKLMLPRSVPFVMAGLRVSAPMAVLGSLIAETAGARRGLGVTMMIAAANFNSGLLFAAALLSALLGLLSFASVVAAERLAEKYMEQ